MDKIFAGLAGAIPLFIVVLLALLIERLKPAQPQPLKAARFNLVYMLMVAVAQAMLVPVVSAAAVLAVNATGGGWIVLPTAGWALLPGFLLYAATLDFCEYLFHRLQHRVPVLWAMHSLHHSDVSLNASTTSRHYWAELGIKTLTVYAAAGMLLKVSAPILGAYVLLTFYNVFVHMNIRAGFGRWSPMMNSPQYHRLHHSILAEHWDCNFAALFPVFDVIFGTYRRPRDGEYPPTGLACGDRPSGLTEAIVWPFRGMRRRLR